MGAMNDSKSASEVGTEDRIPLLYGSGNVDWQQRINWDELRRKRVARAHQYLAKHGIGAAIVYNHDRKRYLSGIFNHAYGKHVPHDFALLIRGAGFPYFSVVTRNNDRARLQRECPWMEGRLLSEEELVNPHILRYQPAAEAEREYAKHAAQVLGLMKKHGAADLPISVDYSSPGMIQALMKAGLKVVDGKSWIDECCMVKFDEEIICMKTAASINEAGYGAIVRDVRIGMTEADLRAIMAKAIYERGGEYIEGWVTNAGDRASPRAFNWSDRPLRPRDFVSLEACHVNYCGYKVCYDRTFQMAGRITEIQREIYQTVVEMQEKFSQLLKPGVTTRELAQKRPKPGLNMKTAKEMREWRATWSNHFGGMGISWDSAPYFYNVEDPDFVLERNMTMAYHAMLSTEGSGGVAIENTYRITENGCESLTQFPFEDIVVLGF